MSEAKEPSQQPEDGRFRLAKGRLYYYWCPDCKQSNGGGVEIDEYAKDTDPYSPANTPCIWCEKGPMVQIFDGVSNGEAI